MKTPCDSSGAFLIPLSQQELQETEKFSKKAAQAARDLIRAEAEIELLQNLLRDKEEQFRIEMEKVDEGTRGANSQVLEIEKLNETMERQRTEIARLRNLLDLTGAGRVLGFVFGVVLQLF